MKTDVNADMCMHDVTNVILTELLDAMFSSELINGAIHKDKAAEKSLKSPSMKIKITNGQVEDIACGRTCASLPWLLNKPLGFLQLCSGCSCVAYCGPSCQEEMCRG